MRKEGVNYRNMLGLFLGAVLCVGSFFPEILDYILRYKTNINIYNETAPAVHIEKAVECIVTTVIAYIECVLLGTIVEAVRAARHTYQPAQRQSRQSRCLCENAERKDGKGYCFCAFRRSGAG